MKRLSKEQKQFQIAQSKRAMRRLGQIKKRKENIQPLLKQKIDFDIPGAQKPHIISVPEEFSILGNMQETIGFFDKVLNVIKRCKPNERLYFDFSRVKVLSADAVMYIIAILKNVKKIRMLNIGYEGNEPEDASAKEILNKVGFYKYVQSIAFHPMISDNENIQISRGEHADGDLAAKMCDFVHVHTNEKENRLSTKRLYPMIIELMTNTKQHAYTENKKMLSNWYVYVENKPDRIQFIFLDTGAGIPNTIRKNFLEQVTQIVGQSDARYISSALRGEFRTQTKMSNRGKGLPEIYQNVRSEKLCCLKIVSGRGFCYVTPEGDIEETPIQNEFNGSLFVWEIIK
jgi:hypothetical protein